MSDLWGWFNEREWEYQAAGDQERLKMARLCQQAFGLSETDPEGMVRANRQGRDLAKRLHEPWWVFLYDVWMAIAYEAHAGDLQNGLKQALHAINEARKPILKDHPWRIGAYNTLLACYVKVDPVGHAPAIRQCIRQLNKEIPPGPSEHRYVMMVHQCDFLMDLGNLKQAEKQALRYQALFDQDFWENKWYLLYPVLDMCWIGWQQQDWQKVQAFAEQAEELARTLENTQLNLVEAQLWQALVARHAGDEKQAKRLFRAAMTRADRLEKDPSPELYDALSAFHELGGDLDKALAARDKQLTGLTGKGRFGEECDTRLKRCQLLAQLGRLTDQDLRQVQAATVPLKNPKPYRARINRLAKQVG